MNKKIGSILAFLIVLIVVFFIYENYKFQNDSVYVASPSVSNFTEIVEIDISKEKDTEYVSNLIKESLNKN